MSSIVRTAVIGFHVAALVALASGCAANNDNDGASTAGADEVRTTPGLLVSGESGGHLYDSEQEMLQDWRDLAVAINVLPAGLDCSSVATCTWDPTKTRVSPDEWFLSDAVNNFTAPDGRTYNWVYLASRNVFVFADRVTNANTYALIEAYNVDVIYDKDTTANAATYAAPIEAWVEAHAHSK